jgi:integrase
VRRLSLGPFPAVGLEVARNRAFELSTAGKAGNDLIAHEKQKANERAARLTLRELIEIYVGKRVRGRLRTAHEIETRLRRALADHLDFAAEDISRKKVRELLDRVADRGAPREAEKQRQLIGAMFRWAIGQDHVPSDPTLGLAGYGTGQRRDRVLNDSEIVQLWRWLEQLPRDYCAALRLQLCTGARIGEVAGIRVEEIDRNWVWTLPASRSKNKRLRRTPLVGVARQIVSERLAIFDRGALFFGEMGTVLSSQHVASMLVKRRHKPMPISHFTSHDLRRTVATRLVEIGVPYETAAAVLGHEAGGRDVRVLLRHYVRTDLLDQKYAALSGWDAQLRGILSGAPNRGVELLNDPSARRLMHLA